MNARFQYHAFATGFAGRITQPFEHTIESQAQSALSPDGGYGSNRVERYRFKEIVSFSAAYTQVAGAYVEHKGRPSWDTVVTSTVEGLEIMGVVKASRIVARLASSHAVDEEEPSILPLGSTIEGLTIAGFHVDIEWNTDVYSQHDTYSKVLEAHRSHEKLDPAKRGSIFGSLVREVKINSGFLTPRGHSIPVPHFGIITLGQLLIDGNARQLTMLQVEPECAVAISCTAGSGQTNGQPVPPPPHDD